MAKKQSPELNDEQMLSSLLLLTSAFKDKISKEDKIILKNYIDKLKKQVKSVKKHTYEGKLDMLHFYDRNNTTFKEKCVISNNFMIVELRSNQTSFNLHPNRNYRITIEELPAPIAKKKVSKRLKK